MKSLRINIKKRDKIKIPIAVPILWENDFLWTLVSTMKNDNGQEKSIMIFKIKYVILFAYIHPCYNLTITGRADVFIARSGLLFCYMSNLFQKPLYRSKTMMIFQIIVVDFVLRLICRIAHGTGGDLAKNILLWKDPTRSVWGECNEKIFSGFFC